MPIKDKVVIWFIRNILLPRNEIIDEPGFIVLKLSSIQQEITNLREILLPESLFVNLEKAIYNEYKESGKQILYSIGKKFGYRYALISDYTCLKNVSEKAFRDFTYTVVRYMESIYSSKIDHSLDLKNHLVKFILNNYVVCKTNGLGYILTDGSIGGIWAYGMGDNTSEGIQIKCQGRNDTHCEFIAAPQSVLKKMKLNFLSESNLNGLEIEDSYNDINAIHQTEYSRTSFQDLINSGFFSQRTGIIKHKDERFLLLESSIMYILENELKKLKGADKILFDTSFEYGKNFVKKEDKGNFERFIMDFLGASGFGDLMILKEKGKYKVIIRYFPWTKWAEKIDFTMIRGMISGMMSGFTSKKVILKKVEKDISQGYFSLVLTE
jgi:predicted hydrocarbon binding protein